MQAKSAMKGPMTARAGRRSPSWNRSAGVRAILRATPSAKRRPSRIDPINGYLIAATVSGGKPAIFRWGTAPHRERLARGCTRLARNRPSLARDWIDPPMQSLRDVVASLIACVVLGCGLGTRDDEAEVRRTVSDDQRCPSAQALAESEDADSAELLHEERIVLTPLCWYRIEVFGADDRCSTVATLAEVRASSADAYAPSDSGIEDSRLRLMSSAPMPDRSFSSRPPPPRAPRVSQRTRVGGRSVTRGR